MIQHNQNIYNINNVCTGALTSIFTLFESRHTLKGRYNIGNVGQTASMSMLTHFESRYTFNNQPVKVSAQYRVWV